MKKEINQGIIAWCCNNKSWFDLGNLSATENGFLHTDNWFYGEGQYEFPIDEHIELVAKMNHSISFGEFVFSGDYQCFRYIVETERKMPFNRQTKNSYIKLLERQSYYGYYILEKYFKNELEELTGEGLW